MLVDVGLFALLFSRCMPIAFHILGDCNDGASFTSAHRHADTLHRFNNLWTTTELVVRREPLQNWFASVLSKTLFNLSHVITQLNCKGRGSIFGQISYIFIYFPHVLYMFTHSLILLCIYIYIPLKTKLECGFASRDGGPFGPPPRRAHSKYTYVYIYVPDEIII